MLFDHSQQLDVQWKHTVLLTWPSATEGCPPFIQLVTQVPHLLYGWHEVGILVPADPSKRNQPGPIPSSQAMPLVEYVIFLLALLSLV